MEFVLLIVTVVCLIICGIVAVIVNNIRTKQNEINNLLNQKDDNKNMLIKQQETLTTMHHLNDNYKLVMDQLQKLNLSNASSSQVISDISSRIASMNDIMVNKKSRGNWGEYQLNTLLSIYAGENQEIFETQYSLKNGYIGDVALHLPNNDKVMMIDSKFPLENYQNLTEEDISETEMIKYISLFKQNIKKHINDISKKYITAETTDQAVMFVPSEAIYTYICGEHSDLIDYAHSKHVLITSPTTLLGVVFTLVNATKDFNRTKHIKSIEKTIVAMSEDAKRLNERIEKTQGYLNSLTKSFDDVKKSSDKITNKINKISDGYVEENDELA